MVQVDKKLPGDIIIKKATFPRNEGIRLCLGTITQTTESDEHGIMNC